MVRFGAVNLTKDQLIVKALRGSCPRCSLFRAAGATFPSVPWREWWGSVRLLSTLSSFEVVVLLGSSENPGMQKESLFKFVDWGVHKFFCENHEILQMLPRQGNFCASHVVMGPLLFYRNSLLSYRFFDAFDKALYVVSSVLSNFLWEDWFRFLVRHITRNGYLVSCFCYYFLI